MDIEIAISELEQLASRPPRNSEAIGFALGVLKHYRKHGFSKRDRVLELPDTTEAFGYFTVSECDESGRPIRIVEDEEGNPIEILARSKVVQ